MPGKVVGKQRKAAALCVPFLRAYRDGAGRGLMQTGSGRRACRQLVVRAQKPRQRPHRCVSGHKGTEQLLTCKCRGEPCPCLLPRKVRAHRVCMRT